MSARDWAVYYTPLKIAQPMHVLCYAAITAAQHGTLHIILTEELGATPTLSPADQKRLPHAAACIAPRAPTDLIEEVNSGASNRRSITAAVIAQMASLEGSIAQTGLRFCQPWGSARGFCCRIAVERGKAGEVCIAWGNSPLNWPSGLLGSLQLCL